MSDSPPAELPERGAVLKPTAVLLAITVVACGGTTFDFAPWTIVLAGEAPVFSYGPAQPEERAANRIELVEDLVIRASDDDRASFFSVGTIAVDASGLIYVVDSGNTRIQVFDDSGNYVRTLGREGQGPGELMLPSAIAVVGNRVVVNDLLNRRLGIWTLAGDHVADVTLHGGRLMAESIYGLGDDAFVTSFRSVSALGSRNVVASFGLDGEQRERFAEAALVEPVVLGERVGFGMFSPQLAVVADTLGGLYLADGVEYQVHAHEASGERRWSLRVAAARAPLSIEVQNRAVELARSRVPDLEATGAEWPELLPAVEGLAVDGHGRLYVFPFDWASESYGSAGRMDPDAESRPVDVYSHAGERLFTGSMPIWRWMAARGDYVYGVGRDAADEETIVRMRVVFP